MRLGIVIGRVTLTQKEPVYNGGRLLIVQPWTRAEFAAAAAARTVAAPVTARSAASAGAGDATPSSRQTQGDVRNTNIAGSLPLPLPKGSSVVIYDELGAGLGSIVGFTEGAEATMPFTGEAPVDAYCACIVDQVEYRPPASGKDSAASRR